MTEVTYFKFNKSFKHEYFDPQNYDILHDELSSIINEQMSNFENVIKEFLIVKGYDIGANPTQKDYIRIVEQLKEEDKFIDHLMDVKTTETKDGYKCVYTYIPFFNCISNPIDEKTKEILLENWRNLHKKEK